MMQRLGERIDEEEQYAVKEMHADRAQGEKVIPVLFEEMDGIWPVSYTHLTLPTTSRV